MLWLDGKLRHESDHLTIARLVTRKYWVSDIGKGAMAGSFMFASFSIVCRHKYAYVIERSAACLPDGRLIKRKDTHEEAVIWLVQHMRSRM